jgi:acyl-CoA synthetase (AMP-forming)/AMP-acid ligase II
MGTISSVLASRAHTSADAIAYTFVSSAGDAGQSVTYQTLVLASLQLQGVLRSICKPGARALLLYPAGLEFIHAFFACLSAELIAVPAKLPFNKSKLARLAPILADAQPDVVLTDSSVLQSVQTGLGHQLPILATDALRRENDHPSIDRQAENWQDSTVGPDTIALLQYTSGSTGSPKGVMVSHANLMHNSACIQQAFRLNAQSRSVSWLPHYHDMGLVDGIVQPLHSGFQGVLLAPETFIKRPIVWLELISRFSATHSGGPNSAYQQCVERISTDQLQGLDLSHWRSAYCGAEPIRPQTLREFSRQFHAIGFEPEFFYPCYGMAEATLMISGGQLEEPPITIQVDAQALAQHRAMPSPTPHGVSRELVGCGSPWLDTQVVIVNPETLQVCAEGEVGEIWTAGPSVAQGYWRQPEESQKTFQACLNNGDPVHYLRTGDLGFRQDGQLFIAGRLKDVIIVAGQNHYPQDIESSVQNCHEALSDHRGAAFSVDHPGGERVVVVQEVRRSHLAGLPQEHIFSRIREVVASDHGLALEAIVLLRPASIPMTSSGKIQRRRCRDLYLQKSLFTVAEWHQ